MKDDPRAIFAASAERRRPSPISTACSPCQPVASRLERMPGVFKGRNAAHAAELARHLAQCAEAVCRQYLCNGRRSGRYWHVGDVANTPGQSLYVHLSGPRAGKWVDAATGDHGDLLDLIALRLNLPSLRDALDEACRFLAVPRPPPDHPPPPCPRARRPLETARRLFSMARPLAGTVAEAYLRNRGISAARRLTALRFHPTCFYRAHNAAPGEAMPALIAAVTDLEGRITGVQRTWLCPSGHGKAPIATPRRSLGQVLERRRAIRHCCRGSRRRRRNRDGSSLNRSCQPCRWWRPSPPPTSRPFCSRVLLSAFTSPAMPTLQGPRLRAPGEARASRRYPRLADEAHSADFNDDLGSPSVQRRCGELFKGQIATEDS